MRQPAAAVPDPHDGAAAVDVAARILSGAMQSTGDIRRRLRLRGFAEDATEYAVTTLTALKYLNDEEFAAALARRRGATLHGRARVAADLRGRSFAPELVAATLTSIDDTDERARAVECARRFWSAPPDAGREEAEKARRRLAGRLQRRGFSAGAVAAGLAAVGGDALVDDADTDI